MIRQDMYMVRGNQFWHCKQAPSKKKFSRCQVIQLRSGKITDNVIDLMSVFVEREQIFRSQNLALEFVANKVMELSRSGFVEVNASLIRESGQSIVRQLEFQQEMKYKQSVDLEREKEREKKIKKKPGQVIITADMLMQEKERLEQQLKRKRFQQQQEALPAAYPPMPYEQKQAKEMRVLLAETWTEKVDPRGYMLSEKLDGMRAVWKDGALFTRNNKPIMSPPFFTKGWPKITLDGELWLGRALFQKLISIVRRQQPNKEEWQDVKYMVFDLPDNVEPFAQRFLLMEKLIDQSENHHLHLVKHQACRGIEHMNAELQSVEQQGGEGLMLRDPNSFYERKRSKTLLKVKSFTDAEAVVVAHEAGAGQCAGQVGALHVRTSDGKTFSVGSGMNQELRRNPPPIGSTITYKYYGTTVDGKPRFPIYLGQRYDE